MRSSSKAALFLGLAALAAPACTSILGDYDVTGGSTSTGSGGGAGGSTTSVTASSSVTSTGAGMTDCVAGDPCSDQNPCTTDSCSTASGKCVHAPVVDGPGPDADNKPNDCVAPACVGGVLMQVPDDADLPDDGNICTADTCSGGLPKYTNLNASTTCGMNQFCDGAGVCVGCTQDAQCADPGACKTASCEMQQCISSNDPAGTTCGVAGGKVCDGNGACVGCVANADCTGAKICIANTCTTSCTDNMKDGTESDVDCGGSCATKCAVGKMCGVNADCASSLCLGGLCKASASCFDLIKNGAESDVDCGGTCAAKCSVGKQCSTASDCVSNKCTFNMCAP